MARPRGIHTRFPILPFRGTLTLDEKIGFERADTITLEQRKSNQPQRHEDTNNSYLLCLGVFVVKMPVK